MEQLKKEEEEKMKKLQEEYEIE